MNRPYKDSAHFWRSSLIPGADMLTAEYFGQKFAPHWHDAYTVSVIEDGAEFYTYRGTTRIADPFSVAVINPGEVHTGQKATEHGWRYRVFYLPVDFISGVTRELTGRPAGSPWFPFDAFRDEDLRTRVLLAHTLLQTNPDPLEGEHVLLDAMTTLVKRHAMDRPSVARLHRDTVRVEKMKARMMANLMEPLTLAELAESVQLSPFHATRLFTKETGLAPHAWRNQMRLTLSLELLRRGMPATSIAIESGFADLSHFTRHFKRAYGVPPGRWIA